MNEAQSKAFDAGNYAAAYEAPNEGDDFRAAFKAFDIGRRFQTDAGERMAFMCGFFSSYELSEVPSNVREELAAARKTFGL